MQTGAEIHLAAYEALASTLTALVSVCSPQTLDLLKKYDLFLSDGKSLLDSLVLSFLQNINNLLAVGVFVRSRRAILMNWKVRNISVQLFIIKFCLKFLSLLAVISYDHENWNFIKEK